MYACVNKLYGKIISPNMEIVEISLISKPIFFYKLDVQSIVKEIFLSLINTNF